MRTKENLYMTTIDLRKAVLEEVIALWDDEEAMQQLLDYLQSLRGVDRQACINGLPYTRQERQNALMQAEADVMSGKVSAHDEVVVRIKEMMETWK